MSRHSPDITEGTLERLLYGGTRRKSWLELRVADAITVALGRPDLLHQLADEVRENPQASAAAREGCLCSGSQRLLADAAA